MFPTLRHCFAGFIGTLTASNYLGTCKKSLKMPGAGSAFFYRRQAERLTLIAAEITNPATRLELLEIAASFLKLADYAAANANFVQEEVETSEST